MLVMNEGIDHLLSKHDIHEEDGWSNKVGGSIFFVVAS